MGPLTPVQTLTLLGTPSLAHGTVQTSSFGDPLPNMQPMHMLARRQ